MTAQNSLNSTQNIDQVANAPSATTSLPLQDRVLSSPVWFRSASLLQLMEQFNRLPDGRDGPVPGCHNPKERLLKLACAGYLLEQVAPSLGGTLAGLSMPDWLTPCGQVAGDCDLFREVARCGYDGVLVEHDDFDEASSWFDPIQSISPHEVLWPTPDQRAQLEAAIFSTCELLLDSGYFCAMGEGARDLSWTRAGEQQLYRCLEVLRTTIHSELGALTIAAEESGFNPGISSTGCLNCGMPEVQLCDDNCRQEFVNFLESEESNGDDLMNGVPP